MRILAALILVALLPACQMIERIVPISDAAPTSPATSLAGSSDELAAYLSQLRALSESALTAEAARQKQLATRDSSDLTRLKAALALSLSTQSDESEILALADPLARSSDSDVRAMASFLQLFAIERRRLRESATAARTSLRDERRALEAQKQRAEALQERAAQLQQKLDALTELEKSLSDRPAPSR
jgi:chromosome segregation ATPase